MGESGELGREEGRKLNRGKWDWEMMNREKGE